MRSIRYYLNDFNMNIEIKKCTNSIHSYKAHFHNEVSIALIESGTSKTEIQDKIYKLTDRTLLIIPPKVVHKCNPSDLDNWDFRMLYISPYWFESAFNIESNRINFSSMKLNYQLYSKLIQILNSFEYNTVTIEDESKLLDSISFLMYKNYNKETAENITLKQLSNIKEFIDYNYLNTITLNDLVKISDISKYYLIRQFENCYGLSPHKYITNLRINHSKKLLKTNKNFVEIALMSGFYDQSHFTKCFKEYTGVTPKVYRNSINV